MIRCAKGSQSASRTMPGSPNVRQGFRTSCVILESATAYGGTNTDIHDLSRGHMYRKVEDKPREVLATLRHTKSTGIYGQDMLPKRGRKSTGRFGFRSATRESP